MHLSGNEFDIMDALWRAGRPLNRAELLKETQGRNWNPASIHLILNALMSKGMTRVTEDSKPYARTYEAVISKEEWIKVVLKEMLKLDSEEEALFIVMDAFIMKNGKVSKKMMKTVQGYLESVGK